MSEMFDLLDKALRDHGQSATRARHTVFLALQGQEPQTMHEVVTACHGKADRASVYRTIALFEKVGIVQRLQIGWKYRLELSDAFHHHHHHLSCRQCGRVIPLPEDAQLEASLAATAARHGFVMQEHQLEIQGLCNNCQQSLNLKT
jgi:Fur family ferric uptake transcriptional regulator